MIGAIPRPGSGGGSGSTGPAVDQTARDAAAAAQTDATAARQDAATRAPQTALDTVADEVRRKASTQAVTDLATAVDQANVAQNFEIGRKANADDVATSLAGKVGNVAFEAFKAAQETKDQQHDSAIGSKADAAATTAALAGKVSTASFTTFSDAVVQKNGEQDTEIARRAVKSDVDAALADKASVTALGAQATRVDGIVGSDGSGGRLKTAETGLATVQADLNTAGTGVKAKVEDLRTRTGQLESGFANVSAAVTPVLLRKLRLVSGFTSKTIADFIAEHFPNQNIGTVTALGMMIGGGGASGFAYSTSGTTPTKYGGGGLPGQILRMRRSEVALTDTIEASIGLGGARASALGTSNANAFAQNAGSPSTVTLKKSNGNQRFRLEAKGGQTYFALSAYLSGSGSFTFWNASTALYQFLPFVHQPLTGGLPGWMTGTGSGSGTTGYTETDADAKAFVNGPTAGGSTLFGGIPSARGGNGGAIQYEPSEWTPDVGVVLGGLGATGVSLNGGAGVSSMEPGTFGTGGGGTFYDYRYLAQGGDGGFPSAGGGEAVNYYSVGTCIAGKGGDGFLDVFLYGYPAAK